MREINLIRLQAGAGLCFAVFLALHLANTLLGVGGPEAYDDFQAGARAFYQHPVVEGSIVLAALVVHLAASLARMVRRRGGRRAPPPLRLRLHRYTGWFLLAVIFGHIGATRGVGFWFEAPAGFGALNFSLVLMPWLFAPYYVLLGCCGLYHLCSGLGLAARVFGRRPPRALEPGPVFWGGIALGCAAIVLAVLTFAGAFESIPRESWGRFGDVTAAWLGVDLHEL